MASKPTTGATGEQHQTRERARIMEAMLALCGEVGYRHATVAGVLARSGGQPSRFYARFSSKEECFAAAYEDQAERLCEALLTAARGQASFREALRAALTELFSFVSERPLIARSILREVYAARGPALTKHEEILERLSRAIESACRETSGSRHSPPPLDPMAGPPERRLDPNPA